MRFLALFLALTAATYAAEKPNILFILSDDVGYGDLGCYGAKLVKTPVIDRLASEGCRFTDVHSPASTCTPTRRAFLTGAYSWRQRPGSAIAPGNEPASILPGTVTTASLLKQAGYKTGVVGKWHLGLGGPGGPDWNGEINPGPLEIGFDYCFLIPATGDRVPTVFLENHHVVGLDPADPIQVSYKAKVGDEPTGRLNPELLRLKSTAGHNMTIVNGIGRIGWMSGGKAARWRDEDIADTLAKKAIGFMEQQSKETPFFLYLATHCIHVPRVPNERFQGSSQAGPRGDAIQELDDTVSQVLAALDRLKLADNTLVIFTSDNGGINDDGYEDFGPKTHPINGPLRGTKGTLFEGGHRIPFIARWPGHITPGSESAALFSHVDMAATFASLTGVALPADSTPDSFDVLPALLGKSDKGCEKFIAHNGGVNGPLAIRVGTWKLIQPGGGAYSGGDSKPAASSQLFDLATDLGERKNVAAENPDKVKELSDLIAKARADGHTR